jgi:hypothetical protein
MLAAVATAAPVRPGPGSAAGGVGTLIPHLTATPGGTMRQRTFVILLTGLNARDGVTAFLN